MPKTLFKRPGEYAVRLLIVAFAAGLLSNILVWIVSAITSGTAGKTTTFVLALLAAVGLPFAAKFRPGKEELIELLVGFAAIYAVFFGLDAIGFGALKYVTDFSAPIGFLLTLTTYIFAEAIYMRSKKFLSF